MLEKLYKKENNLFQSSDWLSFQESLGRDIVSFEKNNCRGFKLDLPLGKKFIWIQKSPAGKLQVDEINEIGKKEKAVFVRLEPQKKPSKGRKVTDTSLLSGQKSPGATLVLDISKTEEEILNAMKPKTRYNIRLSEKKGVKVRVSQDPKDIDILFKLLEETAKKNKGYYHFPKDYYQKMFEELSTKKALSLVIAEHEGEPLSALLVSYYGDVATYLHGGSSENKKNLMAPCLCQWEAMKYAKSKDCKLYDFWGIAATDDPNDPWAGITKFKTGFGGEKVIFPGAFDITTNKFWYNLLTIMANIRRIFK